MKKNCGWWNPALTGWSKVTGTPLSFMYPLSLEGSTIKSLVSKTPRETGFLSSQQWWISFRITSEIFFPLRCCFLPGMLLPPQQTSPIYLYQMSKLYLSRFWMKKLKMPFGLSNHSNPLGLMAFMLASIRDSGCLWRILSLRRSKSFQWKEGSYLSKPDAYRPYS